MSLYGRLTGGLSTAVSGAQAGITGVGTFVADSITGARETVTSNIGETALGLADVTGKITTGAITTVAPVTTGTVQALGGFGQTLVSAPGRVIGGVTAPVGQLSKDILPLVAIAGAILLLRK